MFSESLRVFKAMDKTDYRMLGDSKQRLTELADIDNNIEVKSGDHRSIESRN